MLQFRPYVPNDLPVCLAIFDSNCPGFLHPDERIVFEAWLAALEGTYLVLEQGSEVIGCGGYAVEPEEGVLTLTWGLLHARRHGRGLGELMLLERLWRGIEGGDAACSELATSPRTEPFFARVGYRRVDCFVDGWAPGLDRVDMRLDLTLEVVNDLDRRRAAARERHGMVMGGAWE